MSWVFSISLQYLHEKYLTWKRYLIFSALWHLVLVIQKLVFSASFGQKNPKLPLLSCFLEKKLFFLRSSCSSQFMPVFPCSSRQEYHWSPVALLCEQHQFHTKQMHMWKDIQLCLREFEKLKQRDEHLMCTLQNEKENKTT